MDDSDLIELQRKKTALLGRMTEYLRCGGADSDAGYTEVDIDRCAAILVEFLDGLQKLGGNAPQSELLQRVKSTVLELNALNEQTEGGLIETGQREDLCDYIEFAARKSGWRGLEPDITEEWRDW